VNTLSEPVRDDVLRLRCCVVNLSRARVLRDGREQLLSDLEVSLLRRLLRAPDQPVSRDALLEDVWGYDSARVITRALDTAVCRLRRKLERDASEPDHLLTVHRVGYRLRLHVESRRTNLGPSPGNLHGRAAELAWLNDAAQRPAAVLLGPPGIGKTRLADAHARQQPDLPGGVWLCDLSDCEYEQDLPDAVTWALGLPALQGPDVHARLGRALASLGPTLLVLDGAEVIAEPLSRALPIWLASAPELRCVVTSQHLLSGPWPSRSLTPLSDESAVSLLVERSRGAVSATPALSALLSRLEGLPLALELAAAQLRRLPLDTLLERLERGGFNLPAGEGRSLRRAIGGAWSTLDPRERVFLEACAVFEGGCPADALETVTGAAPTLAEQLKDKSLMVEEPVEPGFPRRYRMLEGVRAYARGRLDHRDPEGGARARHADWFLALGEPLVKSLSGLEARHSMRRLMTERANLRAARQFRQDRSEVEGARLQVVLGFIQLNRGVSPDLLPPFEAARALAAASGALTLEARILHFLGYLHRASGRPAEGMALVEQALEKARASGDPESVAHSLTELADKLRLAGRMAEAREALAEALDLTAPGSLEAGLAWAALGRVQGESWELEAARASLEEAMRGAEARDDLREQARVASALAVVAGRSGDRPAAIERYAESRELALMAGDRYQENHAALGLAVSAYYQGRFDEALSELESVRRYQARSGTGRARAMVSSLLAATAHARGDLDTARGHYRAALAAVGEADPINAGIYALGLGLIALEAGDRPEALARLAQGRGLAEQTENPALRYLWPVLAAFAAETLAECEAGAAALRSAAATAEGMKQPRALLEVRAGAAALTLARARLTGEGLSAALELTAETLDALEAEPTLAGSRRVLRGCESG